MSWTLIVDNLLYFSSLHILSASIKQIYQMIGPWSPEIWPPRNFLWCLGTFFFFYCNYLWGTDINWVEDRDTAKHPIRHKTVPQKQTNKNHPDQKMWVVSGLRNFKSYSIPGALCISMTSRNWLFLFPLRLMTVVWLVLVLLCSKINPTKSPLTIPTV